jgi:hypothetical protein
MGKSNSPGSKLHTATMRGEWWGWFGSISWLFFMMYGFDLLLVGEDRGSPYTLAFMLVFAVSIAAFGWRFGRDPDGLSKVAFYTTPVAVAITASFVFVPQPIGYALYTLSPVLMAPALVRRIYGIIHILRMSKSNRRFAGYCPSC